MQLTEDQIKQLSPDDASTKAGLQLASPGKWLKRCAHEKALWGDCQGSGSTPYSTMVDLQNLAFKCSCPSRKFPCKHGLGLLFLYAKSNQSFSQEQSLQSHVEEWISKRENKQSNKAEKQEKPVDEKAQKKRAEQREQKVDAGIEELKQWLKDLMRTGILGVPQNAYKFSKGIAARMIDAQAAGLSVRLKKMEEIDFYSPGWEKELLSQASQAYALCLAYQKIDKLDTALASDIRQQIGWSFSKEEVLQEGESLSSQWQVLSVSNSIQEKLKVEKIWLYSQEHQRFAQLLNFYSSFQPGSQLLSEGICLPAELSFYPGKWPLRALVKKQEAALPFSAPNGYTLLNDALTKVSENISLAPFAEEFPLILQSAFLALSHKKWFLQDENGHALGLSNDASVCWRLMAICKGKPFSCFALFRNKKLEIKSIWIEGRFYTTNV